MEANSNSSCNFCGRTKNEANILVGDERTNYICDRCVKKCNDLIREKMKDSPDDNDIEVDDLDGEESEASADPVAEKKAVTPASIKAFLDERVIGQDVAKRVISVAAYNHFKRINNPKIDGVSIDKSNIMMIGPTGSGKTLMVSSLAKCLDIPFVTADATSLTEAGYVGEDVESIIGRLIADANYDVARAERGIVFLDEIDKKAAKRTSNGGRDVSGEGVQQGLLKMIEGAELMIQPAGRKNADRVKINTKNILFIVSGAFVGLDKIIKKERKRIGFLASTMAEEAKKQKLAAEHLIEFGIIPELVGRLPVLAMLDELSEEQLLHVLTQPKDAIVKQFSANFKLDGVDLSFTEEALREVAKIAITNKTGARGLRGLIESSLLNTQFYLPSMREDGVTQIIVDVGVFRDGDEPTQIHASNG